jgi:hypothetical protein
MPPDSRGAWQGLAALAGGLLSAVLVLSVESSSPFRFLLIGAGPLPLFAVGFWAGPLTAFAAGLVATVITTAVLGSTGGAAYLGVVTVPVALLIWQATRRPGLEKGQILLLWLTGLAVTGVFGLVGYFAISDGGLDGVIGERFALEPPAAHMAARIAPGLAAAAWMGVIALDGVAAGWMIEKVGLATRPSIDIARLGLPIWIGPILMVAGLAGAVLREGTAGIVCLSSAIVLTVSFAFLGLALIHALVGKWTKNPTWLVGLYAILLGSPALLGWPALLIFTVMLAGLGSADQLMDFRDLRGLRSAMKRK